MSEQGRITGATSVREVLTRYPRAEAILERYGLAGCGGPAGPLEPLGFFARAHHVDLDTLLRELNALTESPDVESKPSPDGAAARTADPDVYKIFVKTSLVLALTAGFALGVAILVAMAVRVPLAALWLPLVQVHGHAQMFGWVGLFIMGIAYHVVPRFTGTPRPTWRLGMASYGLLVAGILGRTLGQPLAVSWLVAYLLPVSGLLEMGGVSIFVYYLAKTLLGTGRTRDFYEKYLVAGAFWFWIGAVLNLVLVVDAAWNSTGTVPLALEEPFLDLMFYGFITMFIFGMSLRILPVFMGLTPPHRRAVNAIFWALTLGIAGRAVASVAPPLGWGPASALRDAGSLASLVELGSVLAFVWSLNVLRPAAMPALEAGVPRGYERFVRAAYAWLVVAALLGLFFALRELAGGSTADFTQLSAERHVIALGFVSLIIVGIASRVVPVFVGTTLQGAGLMVPIFLLFNLGTALRVGFELLAGYGPVSTAAMAASGVLVLLGLIFFAYSMWRTIGFPVARYVEGEDGREDARRVAPTARLRGTGTPDKPVAITKDTNVGELLERYPRTLEVFLRHGFTPLANEQMRRAMARMVTVGGAASIHRSVNLEALLADLNVAAAQQSQSPRDAPPA